MASIFELQSPTFGREVDAIAVHNISGDTTLTAVQTLNTIVNLSAVSGGTTVTTPSAADLVQQIEGCAVDSTFRLFIRNSALNTTDHSVTLAAGTGVTLDGVGTAVVPPQTIREFLGHVTDIKTPAVRIYKPGVDFSVPAKREFIEQQNISDQKKGSPVSARTGGSLTGQIKMAEGQIDGNSSVTFSFFNAAIKGGDNVLMIHGGDPDGEQAEDFGDYLIFVNAIEDGQALVTVENRTSVGLDQQIYLTFTVLKQGVE